MQCLAPVIRGLFDKSVNEDNTTLFKIRKIPKRFILFAKSVVFKLYYGLAKPSEYKVLYTRSFLEIKFNIYGHPRDPNPPSTGSV